MMIKITQKCSMGCTHCMNDSGPNGKHMSFETFKYAIDFQNQYGAPNVMITGGEPFEHPEVLRFIDYAVRNVRNAVIEIATNGLFMQENHDFMYHYISAQMAAKVLLMYQVTNDPRYYPVKLYRDLPIWNLRNVVLIDKVERIYPQGRARNMPHKSTGSKCYNIRGIVAQSGETSLEANIGILAAANKFCTPHIGINGEIRLGESDLCPVCSNIWKAGEEIVKDIRNFQCHQCDFVNKNLPEQYRKIIEGGNQ